MGQVSGMEISSPTKISPREEKLCLQKFLGPQEARLSFPWANFKVKFLNLKPIQKLYSYKSQPSD